jgi:hypothetical protein
MWDKSGVSRGQQTYFKEVCRSNEVLKLWGASTKEQMAVEMPMT